MPLFINRDQIFAHQVHLLEHKLRSKEERILELETENALLHLRLADCLAQLRREHEGQKEAERRSQLQRNTQRNTHLTISRLHTHLQVLKQDLRGVFGMYVSFARELEQQGREIMEKVALISTTLQQQGEPLQRLQEQVGALELSLEEEKEKCREEKQRRRLLHNALVELRGNIRVHCRVRPVLPFDHYGSSLSISSAVEEVVQAVNDDSVLVHSTKPGSQVLCRMFEFERVHGPEDSQDAVFQEVKPLITSLLDGYNVCIMAYGQTGSGKTHTMIGSHHGNGVASSANEQEGIIPKAASELFRLAAERPVDSVEVSVVEVYNNEVLDLLAKEEEGGAYGVKREVITMATGNVEVPGLTHEPVSSCADVMRLLGSVLRVRAQSPTQVHRDSSRSHLVVTLTITSRSANAIALARRMQSRPAPPRAPPQRDFWSPRCSRRAAPVVPTRGRSTAAYGSPEERPSSPASSACSSPFSSPCHSPCPSPRPSISQEPVKTRLQLVDLAGSECVGMSCVSGAALWESSCINRSLSALSDVLGALAEQRPHVPYRNSKLTHLLQDSIGGDAKLLVMLCVSPTQRFLTESLQSLGFGTRARQVQRGTPRTPRKNNTHLRLK
ncbi:kinesin-like protein KIF25 [Engraulis encrasicolus]|uniref:kinesin-like protein KIF25 n=1 Tax=Engraulis encrasicolus TaxID=184585 RepID=UPI002FD296AC